MDLYKNKNDFLSNLTEWRLINGAPVKISGVVVHTFTMGDVSDPDIYAAEPLWQWQQTEMGKWVMENAVGPPEWNRIVDPITYGYKYYIVARLKEQDKTFWTLKWKKSE